MLIYQRGCEYLINIYTYRFWKALTSTWQHMCSSISLHVPGEWPHPNSSVSTQAVPSALWLGLEALYAQSYLQSSLHNPPGHCPDAQSHPVHKYIKTILLTQETFINQHLTFSLQKKKKSTYYQHTILTHGYLFITQKGTQAERLTLSYRWILEVKYFSNTLIFSTLGELLMKPGHKKIYYDIPDKEIASLCNPCWQGASSLCGTEL